MMFPFRKNNPLLINIDIPTKKFTIHHQCVYTEKIKEAPFKGFGELERDGGWIKVKSLKDADSLYEDNYKNFTLIKHC